MIMWATIDEFFYGDLAGIRGPEYYGPDYAQPGFRQIHIRPHVLGDLEYARASIKTVRGVVSSAWERNGNSLTLEVALPVNSRARVSVPKIGLKDVAVTENGKSVYRAGRFVKGVAGISSAEESEDYVTFDVGSGAYIFKLVGSI
jgi:alpha-L-rhamnosidase